MKAGKHLDSIKLSHILNLNIDHTGYEKLLEAASNRLNKKKLVIKISRLITHDGSPNQVTFDVPPEIQQLNKHKFEIILV